MESNYELFHHGVKGMKWGIRKKNYESSTVTKGSSSVSGSYDSSSSWKNTVGKKTPAWTPHRNSNKPEDIPLDELKKINEKDEAVKKYKQNHPDKKSGLEVASDLAKTTKDAARETSNIIDMIPTKKGKMDLTEMSNKELQDAINRAYLERQYNQMFAQPSKTEKGKQVAKDILAGVGSTAAVAGSVLGIILAIKQLRD